MSVIRPSIERLAAVPTELIWRLSVEQYHAMVRTGILTEDDPVELLEGWLVVKMPKNPRHSVVAQLTRETLARAVPLGGMLMPRNLSLLRIASQSLILQWCVAKGVNTLTGTLAHKMWPWWLK